MFPLRVAGAEDTEVGGTANVRSLLTAMMRVMADGTVADRGVSSCRGVGTLPTTATSIITEIAITEVVTVITAATDTTEATDSDECIHPNGFTSEPIVVGNAKEQAVLPKSGVLDTPEPRSHNGRAIN
jgi:hypothetical protein